MSVSAILITGTSHTGKTGLATELSEALGWPVVSTDGLARHPGRPWPSPKPHVAEVYHQLSTETLQTLLSHHHETLRPTLHSCLQNRPVILEGNGLRPELFPTVDNALAVCLAPDPAIIRQRIHAGSDYAARSEAQRALIDAFIERCLMDQHHLVTAATVAGWITRPAEDRYITAKFLLSKIHTDDS